MDAGGTLLPNLALRVRARGGLLATGHRGSFGRNKVFELGTLGVGADYYVMPVNVYAGLTLNIAGLALSDVEADTRHLSKAGLGFDVDLGKEWWLNRAWGVGIAARLSYVSVPPARIAPDSAGWLSAMAVSLLFSATLN